MRSTTRTIGPSLIDERRNELAIIGAGLSGLLTAWRVAEVNPDVTVSIYDRASELSGRHTWSFNLSDVDAHLFDALRPHCEAVWESYDVKFPNRERTLEIGYASTNDEHLIDLLQPYVDSGRISLHLGREVGVADISATAVLDASGYASRDDTWEGWQKFVGRRIVTRQPHGVERPVIMDATVAQIDGYRFFYLLPYGPNELLVEDTYFSDVAALSENAIAHRIENYIADKGWEIERIVFDEKGVLPMTTATSRDDDDPTIGLRGGFSIAATGFTFPAALRTAEAIAQRIKTSGLPGIETYVPQLRKTHIGRERYARLLNRMFFSAADPDRRYVVLQRFYGLREGLIARFYRNGLTWRDKLRILVGKPPVPVTRALYNFSEKAYMRRHRRERRR